MSCQHILQLLKIKFFILRNGFIKGDFKKNFRKIFALVGGAALFLVIFFWIYEIFNVLSLAGTTGVDYASNVLLVVFFVFFIFLLASGVTLSIHYLFISSDLPLLMSAPLSEKTIFSYKLLEAILANSSFFLFIGIPVVVAFGAVSRADWFYYLLMLIVLFLFLTIPVTISFLGALFIVRLIPASRARELMAILLAVVSFGIWLSLQIVRASQFDRSSTDFSPQTFDKLGQLSQFSFFNFLPSTWAARSLVGLAKGDLLSFLFNFVLLALLVFCLFTLSVKLSQKTFASGLISNQQTITLFRRKKSTTPVSLDLIPFFGSKFSIAFSILSRDWKLFIRDSRQVTTQIMMAAMMIIFPLLNKQENDFSKFAQYQPYIFVVLFGGMLAIQMSSRLIPLEAKSFWITKLIPQTTQQIIWGKFLLSFLFSTALCWAAVLLVSFYFDRPLRLLLLALLATTGFSAALSAVGLFLGSRFAQFDWEHPKRMLTTSGGLLLTLALFITGSVIGSLTAGIYLLGGALQMSPEFLDVAAVSFGALVILFVVVLLNYFSARRIENIEWVL